MKGMVLATVAILALGFLSVPVMGAVDAPVWNVGEKWAMGMENDGPTEEQIADIERNLTEMWNLSSIDLDINEHSGIWMTFKVVEDRKAEYVLKYSLAMKTGVDDSIQVSALMPEPGRYTGEEMENASKSMKDMSARYTETMYLLASGYITIEKESMGVKSLTTELKEKLDIKFKGENLPSVDDMGIFGITYLTGDNDFSPTGHELKYEDTEISVHQTFYMNLEMNFDPPMTVIEFPLDVGNTWEYTGNMSIKGNYSGVLDIKGLPPRVESLFTLYTGQDFPIKIEEIETYNEGFDNGTIDRETTMNTNMKCYGTMQIYDESGRQITVYKIGENNYYYEPVNEYILYSPDKGFIAGIWMPSGEENILPLPPQSMGVGGPYASFGSALSPIKSDENGILRYMGYEEAEKNIVQTENEMSGVSSGFSYMYLMMLVVVVAGALIATVAVLYIRKLNKTSGSRHEMEQTENGSEEAEPPIF